MRANGGTQENGLPVTSVELDPWLQRWLDRLLGLGKTPQTLALVQRLKEERDRLPVTGLLICPTSVVTNWEQEKQEFTPTLPNIYTKKQGKRI